ncbi:type III restriction endonuclease subunit R [Synergistales bacterium]|nr:type III restriction endonuclease subunit R [Synergistales bacterium]
MKLQFKHQKFQADAANAVCDVFAGQPFQSSRKYIVDPGKVAQASLFDNSVEGFGNAPVQLASETVLDNVQLLQRSQQIKPSDTLSGKYNVTVEMETGTGKTYTYIKTMYELNKRYGWSKFIIVVPSVAIREGVYKSFQITEEHFAEEYGSKIRYFLYDSKRLTEIDRFASDNAINAMIINSQAFNARGKDARRIDMELDEFRSRKPIDVIAKTNPILIIDEPQSVEGEATKAGLKKFAPLFTLRYSATHKDEYNMVYRLDAMEAYNKKLVKKISVKGISVTGGTATEGYVYLQSVNVSKGNPTATIEFDAKSASSTRKITRIVSEKYNLFDQSGGLEEYREGFVVLRIDGRDNSLEFANGTKLYAGDAIGTVSEEQLRRIQIRETILSHLERERQLYRKSIKVLSLFFIDEVAKYRIYEDGNAARGEYAEVFEDEYKKVFDSFQLSLDDTEAYLDYLKNIAVERTHAGYFSIDKKKNQFVESKYSDKKSRTSDDQDAYDLIMKDKERLLSFDEDVRFIFSHSALREGWDNPNVFQICTLKQSGSEIRKRQEVGRGLRLCVNQSGERMDSNLLESDVHNLNVLTVIANESYDSFAKGLQEELAIAVAYRPRLVTADLFKDKVIRDTNGAEQIIDSNLALAIHEGLIADGYIKRGALTDKYYDDKKNGTLIVADEVKDCAEDVIKIIDSVYDPKANKPDDARKNNVTLEYDKSKLASAEFKALWSKINRHSYYIVNFDEEELIKKAVTALNKLIVAKVYVKIEQGALGEIKSQEQLKSGEAFKRDDTDRESAELVASKSVRYDLIGKLVTETGLTRNAVTCILNGMEKTVRRQFANNPEEFILKAATIINEQAATAIIEHITYDKLTSVYGTDIFTEPTLKGQLGVNALETPKRHLYDHLLYDSDNERKFAERLDDESNVAVYVKLPGGFYINTPVGKYNPDWAIAFNDGEVKHIYFVAETKGSMSSLQLREIEKAKIHCAREHFTAIGGRDVVYDVIDGYDSLMAKVMR